MIESIREKIHRNKKNCKKNFTQDEIEFVEEHVLYNKQVSFSCNIFNIINNISKTPTCSNCNMVLKFRDCKRGYGEFCSRKCSNIHNIDKTKNTNIKKYGSTTFLQSEKGKEKTKQSNINKYGAERYQQTNDFKNKIKDTWAKKTNDEIEDILRVRKQYCNHMFGVDYYFQSAEFKKRSKQTILDRYGVENILQLASTREKINIKKEQIFLTDIEQRSNVKMLDTYNGVKEYKKYKWSCNLCNNIFFADISLGKRPICNVCYPKTGTNIEQKIENFLIENKISYIKRSRKIIPPYELDFFLVDHNIGIEVNGLVWHSEGFGSKDKEYHISKRHACENKNIKLITLYEDDVISPSKFKIITSRLSVVLGLKNIIKINARECDTRIITGHEAKVFLDDNHLNGYAPSSYNYGLFYKSDLIHVCTFILTKKRKIIKSNDDNIELVRSCSKLNTCIRGGISKIIKKCLNDHKRNIITFSDLDWSTNNSYIKAGFAFVKRTDPGYFFIYNNRRYHRYAFTRKTITKLKNYDEHKTVLQNCRDNNIDRLWNCGHELFIYKQ